MQHVIVPKSYPDETPLGEPARPFSETFSAIRLLRVAAVQLPRLSAEDRAALLPYVKRDLGDHPASPDHHPTGNEPLVIR